MHFFKKARFWFLLGVVGCVFGLSGCSGWPTPAWSTDVLFQDDFSVLGGKWSRVRDASGITDYDQGGY
ncbi:MAG: hypothetical protein HUU38_30295, partial [Anaerolineales bacterium]|nr:hypothetical protein [Anaerolineales bacterium]